MHWQRPTMGVIESLKVADMLEIYAEEFGKENIGVLLFEQLKDNPVQFAEDLSAFLGVDAEETGRLIDQRVANERWDEERLAQLKRIARSPWSRWRFRRDQKRREKFAEIPAEGFTGPKPRAQLSEIWRERILDIALGQARRLQKDCRKAGVCPSLNSDIRLVDSSCLGVPLASAEQLDEMREEDQESDRDGPKRGEQDGGAGHIERLADPLVMLLANGPSDPFNRRVQ
jgi:hypothetical protein